MMANKKVLDIGTRLPVAGQNTCKNHTIVNTKQNISYDIN